jgi:hypothetical protein
MREIPLTAKGETNLGPSESSFRLDEGARPTESSHRGTPGIGFVARVPWCQETHRQAQGEHDEEAQARRADAGGQEAAVAGHEEALGRRQDEAEIAIGRLSTESGIE